MASVMLATVKMRNGHDKNGGDICDRDVDDEDDDDGDDDDGVKSHICSICLYKSTPTTIKPWMMSTMMMTMMIY